MNKQYTFEAVRVIKQQITLIAESENEARKLLASNQQIPYEQIGEEEYSAELFLIEKRELQP